MNKLKMIIPVLFLLFTVSPAQADKGVFSEQIYFLEEDGKNALVYTTNRTSYSTYNMWVRNRDGIEPEEYINNFLYIFPDEYSWDKNSKEGFSLLKFSGSDFAGLEKVALDSSIQVNDNGIYSFSNLKADQLTPDGHYGLWNSPDNFAKIAYTWVFPKNFEPIGYSANRPGKWVRRQNTITYYGHNVNDLVFDITYQPSTHGTYESLKNLDGGAVSVDQEATGVKISVEATLLYPSGVAVLSKKGKNLLSQVAEKLKNQKDVRVIVSGHTDNRPISKKLSSTFPTNWELASTRSINVVHFLAQQGIDQSRLESRAFSYHQPIASNETVEGREKNRRIELLIEENGR